MLAMASRQPRRFSAAWPEHLRPEHLQHNSWRRPLRQGALGQPLSQQLHWVLRDCILCFAARGSFKPRGLTSRLAKVGTPADELCGKSDRPVCVLSEDVGGDRDARLLTLDQAQERDGFRLTEI